MDTTPDGRHGKSESWVREWIGWTELTPDGNVEAGAWGTWTITYHVGRYGVDDGGTIVLSRRFASDWAKPQTDAPGELHYASANTSGSASLRIRWDPKSNIRPWQQGLAIDVFDSYLTEGDTVTIVLGDQSAKRRGNTGSNLLRERISASDSSSIASARIASSKQPIHLRFPSSRENQPASSSMAQPNKRQTRLPGCK